jgi:hypothetical protein
MSNFFISTSMRIQPASSLMTTTGNYWLSVQLLNKPVQEHGLTNIAVNSAGSRLQVRMPTKLCAPLHCLTWPIGKICAHSFSMVSSTQLPASEDLLVSSLSITQLGPILLLPTVSRTHGNGQLNACRIQTSTRLVLWRIVIPAGIVAIFTLPRTLTPIAWSQSKDRLSNGSTTCWVSLPTTPNKSNLYKRCSFNERIIIHDWIKF